MMLHPSVYSEHNVFDYNMTLQQADERKIMEKESDYRCALQLTESYWKM